MATVDPEDARRRLESERARVEQLIETARDDLGAREDDGHHGELSGYDQHPADTASDTFEREKELAVLEGFERELAEIEAALERLDAGTYGIDEQTGEPIDPARLAARPEARTNVPHADEPSRGEH